MPTTSQSCDAYCTVVRGRVPGKAGSAGYLIPKRSRLPSPLHCSAISSTTVQKFGSFWGILGPQQGEAPGSVPGAWGLHLCSIVAPAKCILFLRLQTLFDAQVSHLGNACCFTVLYSLNLLWVSQSRPRSTGKNRNPVSKSEPRITSFWWHLSVPPCFKPHQPLCFVTKQSYSICPKPPILPYSNLLSGLLS